MSRPRNKTYTIQVLREGFERFRLEHGHSPSALEIDACPYLCSSRQIQRKFGGLTNIREMLQIQDSDYAVGEHRKKIWANIGALSLISENEVGEFLKSRYGEICVHEEKKYGNGRSRVDFFVYAKDNFAVEVFNTVTIHGITGNLSSKLRKYCDFESKLIFVITGGELKQSEIDKVVSKKSRHLFKENMRCVCLDTFKDECIKDFPPLDVYLKMRLPK